MLISSVRHEKLGTYFISGVHDIVSGAISVTVSKSKVTMLIHRLTAL